ncbi:MAG: hypothetical protein JWQ97_2458, partial [Phenylobacterium sp.]|nr:hypothetical protein [Phenylobacterium sp.]
QAQQLSDQERQLLEQRQRMERQDAEIEHLHAITEATLATARGTGVPAAGLAPPPIQLAQASPVVGGPVGEPPPSEQAPKVVIASVPEFQGVLTPRGHLTLEPQIDYEHGSSNRLVFRGIEIVTGIQIGVIDASNADRNAASAALDVRYGLTTRLELEARLPYLYRADRVSTLSQRDQSLTQTNTLYGSGIGDVELSARYQLNSGQGDWPILIGGLRVKSDTGTSPFTIDRDEFGAATKLATGSGFWGLEGSLSFLYPTDPVVLFGGISYLDQFSKNIDKTVGQVHIGRVRPGGSITANAGFGFAVNPRFSFSLGYKHTYIFATQSDLGGTEQTSTSLQSGQFSVGWSFAFTDRIVLTNTYSIGTTRDAPDMEVMFRLPIRF